MEAITFLGRVFAKKAADDLVLAHELVHVVQQLADGWRFYLRYVFRPSWRVRYEAEAYAVQLKAGVPLEQLAKTLSGPLYLWPCTKGVAAQAILAAAERV